MARKKSAKKSSSNKLKLAAGIAVAIAAAGSFLWLSFGNGPKIPAPAYTVKQVYDGDTFLTSENQKIRLAGIDAPELGRCGSLEAKRALEKLVLNKQVYLKVLYKDPYFRLVSFVYTKDGFVNQKMIEDGFAYYYNREKGTEILKPSSEKARQDKIGIFGPKCTQTDNKINPTCIIKGNNRQGTSTKLNYYFLPTCRQYKTVDVQLYLGDQWFCTESEALKAGYKLPNDCQSKLNSS